MGKYDHSDTSQDQSTEAGLKRLVDTANEGTRALAKLYEEFTNRITVNERLHVTAVDPYDHSKRVVTVLSLLKLKDKTITLSSVGPDKQWTVVTNGISDDYVRIGCKTISKKYLICHLHAVVTHNRPESDEFKATRNGVLYEGHTISWDDASKLLTELEGLGKQ